MRPRLPAALSVLAITIVAIVLGPVSPAAAASFPPVCTSTSDTPGVMICEVPPTPGLTLTSIQWAVNDANVAEFANLRRISIVCTPGTRDLKVKLTLGFAGGTSSSESVSGILCRGSRLRDGWAFCNSGGDQMRCRVGYTGGTPPITIRWTLNGVARSLFNNQTSILTTCQEPGIMSVSVTVRDAVGDQVTVSGTCFCSSGQWP